MTNITEKTSKETTNYVYDYKDPNTSILAYSKLWHTSNTVYCLYYNNAYMPIFSSYRKNQIAAHELGHAFGLKDLYNSSNKGKLCMVMA